MNAKAKKELKSDLVKLNAIGKRQHAGKAITDEQKKYLLHGNLDKLLKRIRACAKQLTNGQHRYFVARLRYHFDKHGARISGADKTEVYYRRMEIKSLLEASRKKVS